MLVFQAEHELACHDSREFYGSTMESRVDALQLVYCIWLTSA